METSWARVSEGDEINLRQVFSTLWVSRWIVIIATILTTSIAVAYALMATSWYRAEVVLVPVDTKGAGMNLGQLGGLASLAGINVPGANSNQQPLAVLKSREFIRAFIEEKQLGPVLFPKTWPQPGVYVSTSANPRIPDIRDAVKYFSEQVRMVTEDKKAGVVTLSIRWKDPVQAANWANELVSRLNDKLRKQALAEAERNTRFLQQQMAETSVITLQQSIGRVLESEMQKYLLAKGNPEFAFKVIDVAATPKFREGPSRVIVVAIGMLLGLIGSCLFVLVRSRWGRVN